MTPDPPLSRAQPLANAPRYRLIGRAGSLYVQREIYEADLDMWTGAGVAGPFESRDAARRHMIETTDERTAA